MQALYRTKIFRRLFLALCGLSLLFFGLVAAAVIGRTRIALVERQLAFAELYRTQLAGRIEAWIDERRGDVAFLASALELAPGADYSSPLVTKKLARFCQAKPQFIDALIAGKDGIVVNGKAGVSRRVSVDDRDYVREALNGRAYVSAMFRGRLTGSASFAVSAPVRIDSLPSFAVAGIVTLADLVKTVESMDLGGFGLSYLLDKEGRLVSSQAFMAIYKAGEESIEEFRLDSPAARGISAGREGTSRYLNPSGAAVLGSWEPLSELGLGLVVELSEDEALAPVYRLMRFSLLAALALALALVASSFVLAAALVKPLGALVGAAEGMIGDRAVAPIELRTGTELDQVIELFNRMSTAVRSREEGLRDSASRDSLTGLYNHGRVEELLDLEIRRRRRAGDPVCFAMLDIDHFKDVNDTRGHQVGDQVLRGLSELLRSSVREGDIVGRYGGEEFAVILAAKSPEEAEAFCERIRRKVEELVVGEGEAGVKVTASLGWACALPEGASHYELVRAADRALYDAKNSGRNCVRGRADPSLRRA